MRYRKLFQNENENLGLFLREARKRSHVSQVELAHRLEMPQSYVSKFERAERRLEIVEFVMICRALEIDPIETLREFLTSDPEAFQPD